LRKSFAKYKEIGDIKSYGMAYNGIIQGYYYQSEYTGMKQYIDKLIKQATDTNDNYLLAAGYIYATQYYAETGTIDSAIEHGIKAQTLCKEKEIWFNACNSSIELANAYLLKNDLTNAYKTIVYAKKLNEKNDFLKFYTSLLYYIYAEILLSHYKQNKKLPNDKKVTLAMVKKAYKKATSATKPWSAFYGASLRGQAKVLAFKDKNKKAEDLFLQSIEHNKKLNRRYELAKSHLEYGLFLKNNKHAENAKKQFEQSYEIFKEIGAKLYINKLENILGYEKKTNVSDDQIETRTKQQLSAMINATREIASELNVDQALEKALSFAMEATGAHRGAIFTIDHGKNPTVTERKVRQIKPNSKRRELKPLNLKVAKLAKSSFKKGISKKVVNRVYEEVAKTNKTFINENFSIDSDSGPKSVLAAPIILKNKIMGICYFDNLIMQDVFDENHIDLVEGIMNSASIALENASLYEKQKFMTNSFKVYVPEEKIREVEMGIKPTLGGTEHNLVVGFEDIRNFTTLSEKIGAADTFGLINSYFTFSGDTISSHGGRTNRYLGDARLMIFEEKNILDSVIAFQNLRLKIRAFNDMRASNIKNNGWTYQDKDIVENINTGLGLDFGKIMIGNEGDPNRMDYTVIGDAANTAARLESLTKIYKTPIIISENVYRLIAPNLQHSGLLIRKIDQLRVKGKNKPLGIYEVYSYYAENVKDLRQDNESLFNEGLDLLLEPGDPDKRLNDWKKAQKVFSRINEIYMNKLPENKLIIIKNENGTEEQVGEFIAYLLAKRSEALIKTKKDYYDGVYDFTVK